MGVPSPRSTDASWIQQWDQCMSDDVVAMREWLDALRQDPQAAKDQEVIARTLNQRIAQSMRRVEKRQKQIPAVSFPAHLPVSNRLEDITGVRSVVPSQEGSQLNHFQDELLRNWS